MMGHGITRTTRKSNHYAGLVRGGAGLVRRDAGLDYLKANDFQTSLTKLRIQVRDRQHKHSVFQHHPNAFEIYGEDTFMQKVNYIHQNPVRAGLCQSADDYVFSSSRLWNKTGLENEPFITEHDKIKMEIGGVAAINFSRRTEKRSFSAHRGAKPTK